MDRLAPPHALVPAPAAGSAVGPVRTPPPAPTASDARIDPSSVLSILRRGAWLIVGSLALALGAAAAYTYSSDPVYQASAMVAVEAQPRGAVMLVDDTKPFVLSAEVGLLRNSVEIAERVVERLEESVSALGTDAHYPLLLAAGPDSLSRAPARRRLARALLGRVQFAASESERMVSISVESSTPEEAAQIANLYAEEYEAYARETSRASVVAAREYIEAEVAERQDELSGVEGAWAGFARREGIVSQGDRGERLVAEYGALSSRRDAVRFSMDQEQTQLRLLESQLAQVEPEVRDVVRRERSAAGLESEIAQLDNRLATLSIEVEEYYAVNPSLRGNEDDVPELAESYRQLNQLRERRRSLTDNLVNERHQISEGTVASAGGQLDYVARLKERILEKRMSIQSMAAERSALDQRLGGTSGRMSRVPGQIVVQDQLTRRREQLQRWHDTFDAQLQELRLAEASELGYVTPVRAAAVPLVPVRPNPPQNFLLGGLLGLGVGLALAFGRAAVDHRFQDPETLQEQGYHLLGVVPDIRPLLKSEFRGADVVEADGRQLSTRVLTALSPWSPFAERFRLLRTQLQTRPTPPRVLLVTSPEPGDGKTTTAVNLAVALAQGGKRTLLVDADLHRPTAHTLLGEDRAPGLADLLGQDAPETQLSRVADGLEFLAAGDPGPTPPAELLGSRAMEAILRGLRDGYDMVVVDAPPVLSTSDAVVLATRCDAVLLVASAGKTDIRALNAAQDSLRAVGADIAGIVVNRYDAQRSSSYRYRYGYGYGDAPTSKPFLSSSQIGSPASGASA